MRTASLTALLILSCLIWAACKAEPERLDPNFLRGIPCAAPCWQGITPGLTSEAEALEILSDPDLVEEESLVSKVPNEYFFQLEAGANGTISVAAGIIQYIRLYGYHDSTISTGDLVDALGPPESVYVQADIPEEGGPTCYIMELLYPERGIYARVFCNPPDNPSDVVGQGTTLDREAEIDLLIFSAPPSLPFSYLHDRADLATHWQGFTFYLAHE